MGIHGMFEVARMESERSKGGFTGRKSLNIILMSLFYIACTCQKEHFGSVKYSSRSTGS